MKRLKQPPGRLEQSDIVTQIEHKHTLEHIHKHKHIYTPCTIGACYDMKCIGCDDIQYVIHPL